MEPIPQQRIIEKLDEYMSHRDYEGAEKHLLFWLDEARALGDERGELLHRDLGGALGRVHARGGEAGEHGAFFLYFRVLGFFRHISLSFKAFSSPPSV